MTFLNFNKQCPASIELRSVAGLTIKTYKCVLMNGHTGPHRDKEGAIFIKEMTTNHGRIEAY